MRSGSWSPEPGPCRPRTTTSPGRPAWIEIHRSRRRTGRPQRLVNHRREPVHPLAEIDRLHRDQDLHARGGNDHAAPFSARTILASVAPSAVNGTRATIAPTRISKTAPSSEAFSAGPSNITGAKPGASDLSIARPLDHMFA